VKPLCTKLASSQLVHSLEAMPHLSLEKSYRRRRLKDIYNLEPKALYFIRSCGSL